MPTASAEECGVSCVFQKTPGSTLDYTIDWTKWLAGDEITASTWDIDPSGQLSSTLDSITPPAPNGKKTTVWLTGGIIGRSYKVKNHITTAAGRQEDRTFLIQMVEK